MPLPESLSKPLPLLGTYIAAGICYYASLFWRQSRGWKTGNLEESFSMIFVPIALAGLFVAAVVATPYFWLFPERHMHVVDTEGTDEEKLRLERYREYQKRVGVAGRIAERLGWRPFDMPPDDLPKDNEPKN
jgi:hypothetical protein